MQPSVVIIKKFFKKSLLNFLLNMAEEVNQLKGLDE